MPESSGTLRQIWPLCVAIFLAAFFLLFLGMDRYCSVYDEGIMLTGAMRVAAGNVPHRDFYINYGPAEFYILAWLFRLFGSSVFVERIFDLSVKAGIVTACFALCRAYCRPSVALAMAAVCWLWLFSFYYFAAPLFPALLLSLVGSGLLLWASGSPKSNWKIFSAGAVCGLTALFRYDVGFGLLAAHLCFLAVQAGISTGPKRRPLADAALSACRYVAGATAVFAPPALLYLAVAPLHSFVADIIVFPSKYYARARSLPFPGIHLRSIDDLAVYLPIVVIAVLVGLCVAHESRTRLRLSSDAVSRTGIQDVNQFLILFGILVVVFYGKGLVRVSTIHMFLSIAPSLLILGVLYENIPAHRSGFRTVVFVILGFATLTAAWAAAKDARRVLLVQHSSILAELASPPGPAAINKLTSWCGTPNPIHRGLCFLVDADHIKAITFLDSHTTANDKLFTGLPRHDKIFSDDVLTYFAAQRMPATGWYQFDPDLQTRADIQTDMINDISSNSVPYILLDSEFDTVHEANDSSKSSNVTLLDRYIRDNYLQVESFGELSVWEKTNRLVPVR